jgi:hypothetical protein
MRYWLMRSPIHGTDINSIYEGTTSIADFRLLISDLRFSVIEVSNVG